MFSRETIELESQLDAAAMRSRRVAGVSQSDTHVATTTQLHALELHNSDLQVCLTYSPAIYNCCDMLHCLLIVFHDDKKLYQIGVHNRWKSFNVYVLSLTRFFVIH